MKLITILILSILVSSCQSFYIEKPWPVLPEKEKELYLTPCESLELLQVGVGMSELIASVEQNYLKWHNCSLKLQGWITWYNSHWNSEKK
jgi:hypothetical protein